MPLRNPVISPDDGTLSGIADTGGPLAGLMARLWQTAVLIGGLLVILWLVWGAVDYLNSAGDPEKTKKARGKIIDAVIGLVILVMSYAIVKFLEFVFGFDLVNLVWPTL
jgi:type IV secretion system pilin